MQSQRREKEVKRKMRVILLILIGGIAFSISIITTIIGITDVIKKSPDSSGMSSFSVRTNKANVVNEERERGE